MKSILKSVASTLIEVVYPKVCAGCGLRGVWICSYCESLVPELEQTSRCDRCGVPWYGDHCRCGDLHPSINRAQSVYPYAGWVSEAIKRFKYGDEPARVEMFAAALTEVVRGFGPIDGVIPVPLHPRKLQQRGYNQSALLADRVSTTIAVPVMPILRRVRQTRPQVKLNADERHVNVRDAFALDPAWSVPSGRAFVLIDDVRTTGATLNACATVLQTLEPARLFVTTIALDLTPPQLQALAQAWSDRG